MGRYILIRLASVVGVLFAVTLITFILMHAVPGGPFDVMAVNSSINIPDDIKQMLMKNYGLDKPVWEQYILYMGRIMRLDFGYSYFFSGQSIMQIFIHQWPYSIQLGLLTMGFSIIVGMGLGVAAAIYQGTWVDFLGTAVALFCLAMPSFVLAIMLQLIFAIKFGSVTHLPTGGWAGPQNWILPVLANSLGPVLILQRFTKGSMVDVMRSNYVRTARAKGMKERRVVFIHILKNALTPIVTVGGPMLAGLMTGSFFVESIFRIPGIGQFFVQAIGNRDYPLIMATTIAWTTIITLTYLVTDLVYALIDPRVTYVKEK